MKEIEVKILEINKKEVEKKLKQMGAKKAFDGLIDAQNFDFPDRRIKKKKNLLRLRKMDKKVFLTYKIKSKAKSQAKVCEEIELEVMDFEKMKLIFENLGLETKTRIKKHRTSYKLGSTHFEIEQYLGEYSNVPCFLEIEAPSIKVINKYAKKLGFNEKDCLNWNTWDVVEHYEKVKNL
ncbi:MAG: class IV adenylate cyclase [archaeon]|jgi:adenylate cyclase class 2